MNYILLFYAIPYLIVGGAVVAKLIWDSRKDWPLLTKLELIVSYLFWPLFLLKIWKIDKEEKEYKRKG